MNTLSELELLFHAKLSDLSGKDEISGKLTTRGGNHSIQVIDGKKGLNFISNTNNNNFMWSELNLAVNSEFTASYWVYCTHRTTSNHQYLYFFESSNQGNYTCRIFLTHASANNYSNTHVNAQPYYIKLANVANKTIVGSWKLLTTTFTKSKWIGYQNGILIGESNDTEYKIPDITKIRFSDASSSNDKPLPAELFRELKIYKGVLSPEQILAEYQKGLAYE